MGNTLYINCEAFWISPEGSMLSVCENHIGEVIRDPGFFGLTMDYIMSEYEREGEPLGLEGRARRTIILGLIKQGWIRIRRYPHTGSWTVNIKSPGESCRSRLIKWSREMLDMGISGDDVVHLDLPGRVVKCELGELNHIK